MSSEILERQGFSTGMRHDISSTDPHMTAHVSQHHNRGAALVSSHTEETRLMDLTRNMTEKKTIHFIYNVMNTLKTWESEQNYNLEMISIKKSIKMKLSNFK